VGDHGRVDVSKENVQPPPLISVAGGSLGEYFCYRLSCPKAMAPMRGSTIAAADQFGARVIRLAKRSPLLCVPATRSVPPTTTPTPATPSATPTGDTNCTFDGNECHGPCLTSGRCPWDPAQSQCVCPAAFDMDCNQFNVVAECGHGALLCPGPGQGVRPLAGHLHLRAAKRPRRRRDRGVIPPDVHFLAVNLAWCAPALEVVGRGQAVQARPRPPLLPADQTSSTIV
jgi:hypothetical protein